MNAPARFVRAATCALAASAVTACAGHASAPFSPTATTPLNQRALRPAMLSGVIKTDKYEVAAGKTLKVTGDLTVFATDSIDIAGTLEVPRGTTVAFFSPQFTLTGSIAPVAALNANAGPAVDSIDACSLSIQGNGGLELPYGDTLVMASTEPDCDLTVGNYTGIHLDPAPASTPLNTGQGVGGRGGGNIAIGIKFALLVIKARAGSEPFGAYAPRNVNLSAPINAGTGGAGSPGMTRYAHATCYFDAGGDGGRGGAVSIAAERVNQLNDSAAILAGSGGEGGVSGSDLTICHYGGTPAIPKGANVVAVSSSGGSGGYIDIETSKPGSKLGTQTAGTGGGAGFAAGLFSAPSYCTMPPCSANYSNVELHVGLVGAHGTGGHTKVLDGTYPPFSATTLGGQPSTGAGGSFTLVYPIDLNPPIKGLTITLTAFGIGGSAPSNCGAPGSDGAAGGTLHDNGAFGSFKIDPFLPPHGVKSFSGGNGGNGTPPGKGGIGGFDDEHHKIGNNGAKGTKC